MRKHCGGDTLDEEKLTEMLRSSDSEAYFRIMETYNKLLWVIVGGVLNSVGTREDIEECISDVYVDLWRKPKAFDPSKGSLKTFLAVMAKSKALDRYRQLTKAKIIELDEAVLSADDDLLEYIAKREMYDKLYEAILSSEWDYATGGVGKSAIINPKDDQEIMLLKLGTMAAPIGGLDWAVVTNAGMINGQFHLQIKKTKMYSDDYNSGVLLLLNGEGGKIESALEVRQDGYRELVFDIGDSSNLESYKLAMSGQRNEYIIQGPWQINFTVDSELPKVDMTVTPKDSPYFAKLDIICSPMTTTIRISSHNLQRANWDATVTLDEFVGKSDAEIIDILDNYNRDLWLYLFKFDYGDEPPCLTLNDGRIILLEYGD